ncbi:MAG: hypothetical protein Q4B43_06050 [Bacteroidota bacterium]|nr:hypothetical protein [Bacteroidota bacterium]
MAQEEIITFVYEKSCYEQVAKNYISKMIEVNKLLKKRNENYAELYTGDIDSLEIIIYPIFDFKKGVLNYKDKDNLLSYVDFKNYPDRQMFKIYHKGEFMYTFLPDEKWEEALKKNDLAFFEEWLRKNPFESTKYDVSINFIYTLRNDFSFILKNTECIVVNGQVFVINVENLLKTEEFNSFFIEDLHLFQNKF